MEGKGREEVRIPETELPKGSWCQWTPGPPTPQQVLRPRSPMVSCGPAGTSHCPSIGVFNKEWALTALCSVPGALGIGETLSLRSSSLP